MQILGELFSNPIALFILIGVIMSLFTKRKTDGSQQQQRRPVLPGPVQQSRPAPARRQPAEAKTAPSRPRMKTDEENQRAQDQNGDRRRNSPVEAAEVLTDIQKKYSEQKHQTSAKKQQTGRMSPSQSSGRLNQKREQIQSDVVFQPKKDTLVEGLIWAEVIGKPRAKNPYSSSRK